MKKILVIEEDDSLFKAYQGLFKPEGIDVVGAGTGQEGLDLIVAEKPDLIILDIMLPGGMNGFDVLKQLKINSATEKIPVIMLTNLDSEEKVAQESGAAGYLVKANTTEDQIVKLVKECLKSPQTSSSKMLC